MNIMTRDTFLATMGGNNTNIQFKGSVKNLELNLDSTLSMPGFEKKNNNLYNLLILSPVSVFHHFTTLPLENE